MYEISSRIVHLWSLDIFRSLKDFFIKIALFVTPFPLSRYAIQVIKLFNYLLKKDFPNYSLMIKHEKGNPPKA